MKRTTIYTVAQLLLLAAVTSCSKEEEVGIADSGFELNLVTRIESMEVGAPGTRAAASLLGSKSDIPGNALTLYGWEGSTLCIDSVTATYASGKWSMSKPYTMDKDYSYTFLAYANMPAGGAAITMPDSADSDILFKVTDIAAAQNDVLIGKGSKTSGFSDGDVDIAFSHPFASVKFMLGNADGVKKVTGVSLTGVYESGSTEYSTASTLTDSVTNYSWSVPGTAGATVSATGLNVTDGEIASFVVIPQTLSTKSAVITVTYVNNSSETKTMAKLLNTGSWIAGYTTVYAIDRIGSIIVNVSDDGRTITNGASSSKAYIRATITGAWYESSNADAPIVAPWSMSDGNFTGLFPTADWTAGADEIYYLKNALAASGTATTYTSFSKPTPPSGLGAGVELRLNVLIQAIPYNINKTCQEAFAAL